MKVYEINQFIRSILESDDGAVDEETGVVLNLELLDRLDMKRKDKLENIALYIEELKGMAGLIKDKAKAMRERADAKENKARRLTRWLIEQMTEFGDRKLETENVRVTRCDGRNSLKLSEDVLPSEYFVERTVKEVNKDLIRQQLDDGVVVQGAMYTKNPYLIFK